ncbi:non-ribosomal peptide synthetase, partial [Actinocrinis puniceicyclus]
MAETLAERLAQLSPEKRRLLLDRLRRDAAEPSRPVAVPRDGGPLPLSFAQERLWFLWRLAPQSAAYNAPVALRLRGALDAAALQEAVSAVVARHEVLRTRYAEGADGPVQVIDPHCAVPLPLVDVPAGDERECEKALRALVTEAAEEPFDLATGPVLRCRLFRAAPQDHVLLLVMHHIACDGWSLPILWHEVAQVYRSAAGAGAADKSQLPEFPELPELPELPLQYADFASWQRKQSADGEYAAQLDYWERQLAAVPALELPADRARPAAPSFAGGRVEVRVAPRVAAELRRLAGSCDATMFMVLLAAFQVLLGRVSGCLLYTS